MSKCIDLHQIAAIVEIIVGIIKSSRELTDQLLAMNVIGKAIWLSRYYKFSFNLKGMSVLLSLSQGCK